MVCCNPNFQIPADLASAQRTSIRAASQFSASRTELADGQRRPAAHSRIRISAYTPTGRTRHHVYFEHRGTRIAIEVQKTGQTLDQIDFRTRRCSWKERK